MFVILDTDIRFSPSPKPKRDSGTDLNSLRSLKSHFRHSYRNRISFVIETFPQLLLSLYML